MRHFEPCDFYSKEHAGILYDVIFQNRDKLLDNEMRDEIAMMGYFEGQSLKGTAHVLIAYKNENPVGAVIFENLPHKKGVFHAALIKNEQNLHEALEFGIVATAHAFDVLDYRKLIATIRTQNHTSERVARGIGFTKEGLHHQDLIVNGSPVHTVQYGLCADGWRPKTSREALKHILHISRIIRQKRLERKANDNGRRRTETSRNIA